MRQAVSLKLITPREISVIAITLTATLLLKIKIKRTRKKRTLKNIRKLNAIR